MQFKVPQFIDVEDKIFGPLTFKQFVYLLGAGGSAFIFWKIIPIKIIALIFTIPFSGTFIALAFVKINDRPFIDFLESAFHYFLGQKIYVWRQPVQHHIEKDIAPLVVEATKQNAISKVSKGRLRELAFGLDVIDRNAYKEEDK